MTETPARPNAAQILHDARWMAGLTQAEVAQRAGVTQQVVAAYERGRRDPSLTTLTRLVQGCGIRLSWRLVPEEGLEDSFTTDLLGQAPLDRLPAAAAEIAGSLPPSTPEMPGVIGDKAAARLHGADVRVYFLELWFDPACEPERVNAYLADAGFTYITYSGVLPIEFTKEELAEGRTVSARKTDVEVRTVEHFPAILSRATTIRVPGTGRELLAASVDDCTLFWSHRDLSHLALQRAVRLMRRGWSA